MIDYQRVVAEIDLDAIASNMREIRRITQKDTKVMAIVKADAYGHGAVELSKVLLYNGADMLGVAILDEALQLRMHNIHVPILILGYTPEAIIEKVVTNNIIQTIFSFEMAEAINKVAMKHHKKVEVHIKIDTGMGRLGFLPIEKTVDEIEKIYNMEGLHITGIYTHFSSADEAEKTFTYEQLNRFIKYAGLVEERIEKKLMKHVSNSAAIIHSQDFHFDCVRAGIILYGHYPSEEVEKENIHLIPSMSLKTHVSYIKELEKGSFIGYGRTFVTNRKSKIATIPVGYADGYSRALNNGGRVLISGQYAPIVGRICMDQFMVDVTEIENIKAGDEVVLFGKQLENRITVEEIATIMGTINYEVLCLVGKRVPRVYFKNNAILKIIHHFS